MPSAGDSSPHPTKGAPATAMPSTNAIARQSPMPLSVARMSRSSVPLAGSRRPRTSTVGCVASCTTNVAERSSKPALPASAHRSAASQRSRSATHSPPAVNVATPSPSMLSSTPADVTAL